MVGVVVVLVLCCGRGLRCSISCGRCLGCGSGCGGGVLW